VEFIDSDKMICCGTSGLDISKDAGMNCSLLENKGSMFAEKLNQARLCSWQEAMVLSENYTGDLITLYFIRINSTAFQSPQDKISAFYSGCG
jgi:hypothetical protein